MKEKNQFFYVNSSTAPTDATIQLEQDAVYKANQYATKFIVKKYSP